MGCYECGIIKERHDKNTFGFHCNNVSAKGAFVVVSNLNRILYATTAAQPTQFRLSLLNLINQKLNLDVKMSLDSSESCHYYLYWQTFIRGYNQEKKVHNWLIVFYILIDYASFLLQDSTASSQTDTECQFTSNHQTF
jgi:hypothetical protein